MKLFLSVLWLQKLKIARYFSISVRPKRSKIGFILSRIKSKEVLIFVRVRFITLSCTLRRSMFRVVYPRCFREWVLFRGF